MLEKEKEQRKVATVPLPPPQPAPEIQESPEKIEEKVPEKKDLQTDFFEILENGTSFEGFDKIRAAILANSKKHKMAEKARKEVGEQTYASGLNVMKKIEPEIDIPNIPNIPNINEPRKRGIESTKITKNEIAVVEADLESDQKKKHSKKKKKITAPAPEKVGRRYDDERDYDCWMPPTGQTGDGKTQLNDRFGY